MIKKYLEFIKESLKEKIEEKSIWKLSEDDIREYLLELTDAGYLITVGFGFCEKVELAWKPDSFKDVYTEKVKSGDSVRPAYWIEIQTSRRVNNDNVTSVIHFAHSIISEEANADITIKDADGSLDLDKILLKGGLFINTEPGDDYSGEEAEDYIAFFVKQKDTVEISESDLMDYYGWEVDEVKNGNLYLHIELEDMCDIMLDRKDRWKDILVGGMQDGFWDNYYGSDYQPDFNSLLQYTLDKDNEVLLVKSLIKEVGGLEDLIAHIGDECSDEAYENVKGKSEEEVINYLLKERFHDTLKQLCKNSDTYQDLVANTAADWEMNAHADANFKELSSKFDDIVGKEFEYTKIIKEVKKSYKSKDAEGNQTVKEYTEEKDFYVIEFMNEWLQDVDSEDLYNRSLRFLFDEWCGQQYFTYEIDPHFSDWGNVNNKELNSEIKGNLERYLKK
jgi:hypothetical protein